VAKHIANAKLLSTPNPAPSSLQDADLATKVEKLELVLVNNVRDRITAERETAQQQVTLAKTVAEVRQQQEALAKNVAELQRQGGLRSSEGLPAESAAAITQREQVKAALERLNLYGRQLDCFNVRMAENDLRFQLLETASYDGNLVWKIGNYAARKVSAQNRESLSIFSPPFYTGRFGYRMCLRAYLNGDGMGAGTHFSLFYVVMKGEYDALLRWPFRHEVALSLLDQSGGDPRSDLSDRLQPLPASSTSLQRPTTEMNVALGSALFVTQHNLEGGPLPSKYLKDDCIFIKAVVNPNPVSP